jgi:hypothetical protein
MKALWQKQNLPTYWKFHHASLPAMTCDMEYLIVSYNYVATKYDGSNWAHHLALIIVICFSCIVPDICIDKTITVSTSDSATVGPNFIHHDDVYLTY